MGSVDMQGLARGAISIWKLAKVGMVTCMTDPMFT